MLPFFESKTALLQSRRSIEYFDFPLHMHTPPELIYINEGTLDIVYPDCTYHMEKGDFAIIFPYTIHGYSSNTVMTDYTLAIGTKHVYLDFEQLLSLYHPANPIIKSCNLPKDIPQLMNELVTLNDCKDHIYLVKSIYSLILARTIPLLQLKDNTGSFKSNLIVRAITYVSEHFTETISLDTVSSALGISKFDVSRLFSSSVKMTFVKYVNYMRISYAKELLEKTELSILDIALECGFDTLRTFNRVFKSCTNTTPFQYRKEHKSNSTMFK